MLNIDNAGVDKVIQLLYEGWEEGGATLPHQPIMVRQNRHIISRWRHVTTNNQSQRNKIDTYFQDGAAWLEKPMLIKGVWTQLYN